MEQYLEDLLQLDGIKSKTQFVTIKSSQDHLCFLLTWWRLWHLNFTNMAYTATAIVVLPLDQNSIFIFQTGAMIMLTVMQVYLSVTMMISSFKADNNHIKVWLVLRMEIISKWRNMKCLK